MDHYQLFAARDGDVIAEDFIARDDGEARVIAAHRIVEGFDLEMSSRDFDEVTAETDGAILNLRREHDIPQFAAEWACSQLTCLRYLEASVCNPLRNQVRACQRSFLDLVMAIDRERSAKAA